jgi:hypothetical protein
MMFSDIFSLKGPKGLFLFFSSLNCNPNYNPKEILALMMTDKKEFDTALQPAN